MQTIEIVAAVIGLIYVWLEAKASFWLWPVGVVLPLFYIYISYQSEVYGNLLVNVYYLLACIYGWVQWYKNRDKGSPQEQISFLSRAKAVKALLATLAIVLLFLFVFARVTHNAMPVPDALATGISFVGMWLLAHKYIENWYAWIGSNILYTYIFFALGYTVTGLFFTVYSLLAVWGLFNWLRLHKVQSKTVDLRD